MHHPAPAHRSRRLASRTWPCVVAVAAVALAAVTAAGASAAPSASGKPSLAQLRSEVAHLMKRPTSIGIETPLKRRPTGKLLIQMRCAAPICVQATPVYKAAATALGMKFEAIDTGATPTSIGSAFDQAVAAHPAGLISGAIPPQLFQKQLKKLVAEGTKVALYATAPPNPPGVAAFAYPPREFAKLGREIADFITVDAKAKPVKILYVEAPEFTALKVSVQSFMSRLKVECPACSADTINVQSAEIGKGIPGQIVSYLQAHPDTEYVVSQFGDLEVGVPQALKAAGITGKKLITSQGSPVNMQYVKNGEEYADIINYLDVTYWQTVDMVARALDGQKVIVPPAPSRWITKRNLDFNPKQSPPFGSNYRAEFKKLWK